MNSKAQWWDKLGKPQYGGEMVVRASRNIENFDPYFNESLTSIYGGWMERLVADDWTLDPEVFNYRMPWHPSKYMKGQLAESWEFTGPGTHVIHLRKGIHWQNIPPANGREFVADDVVFHYSRLFGLGDFSNPSPYRAGTQAQEFISVTAADKYTVVFQFKAHSHDYIMDILHGVMQSGCLVNPDAVKKWGDASDWHHAIGTGPFILKDFVSGSHATIARYPDYWGYDERYPQNKLPYLDSIKYVVIPDDDAALDAMRAGNIDILSGVNAAQAQSIQKTNPEILQLRVMSTQAYTIQPRNDMPPFNDIRVRKAMQMAIDLESLARDYYGGTVSSYPSTISSSQLSRTMKGWGFPYEEWPQDLRDEYAYNTAAAKQLLSEAGYPNGFTTNIVVDIAADQELLKIVARYFAEVGIKMEMRTMESNACTSFVGDLKQDQLVYREYGPLGHCYSPYQVITRLHTGNNILNVSDPIIDSYAPRALATNNEDELKQIMRDVNERVARQHFAISLLQPNEYTLCQPWVKGFSGQGHALWLGIGGPSRLSFYGARYWLDHDMKKSMGH